jgi:pimeloyl-ACP methyl ester carboxylesterase
MIHSIDRGVGPPVILIHGLAASLKDWDTLMPAVASLGCRTWAFDLPGHGDSQKPEDPGFYSIGPFFTAIEDWLADLPDNPPYILVGHSLGGYLSLRFALRHPGLVRALVLIDPLFSLNHISSLLRWIEHLPGLDVLNAFSVQQAPLSAIQLLLGIGPLNQDRLSPEQLLQIAADYKRTSPHLLRLITTLTDLEPFLGRIQTPSLVIWGDKDLTLDPASFPRLVSLLPNAQGHLIQGSGHQPHIGRPDLVNPLVTEFIQIRSADAFPNPHQPAFQSTSQGDPDGS